MRIQQLPLLALTVVATILNACGNSEPTLPLPEYVESISPEAVVQNMEVAFQLRDFEGYERLLHPDFEFHFHPEDALVYGATLNRERDLEQMRGLFNNRRLLAVRARFQGTPSALATEVGVPAGTYKIRVNQVGLELDGPESATYLVAFSQDMFFLPDPENPQHWQVVRWRELPTRSGGITPQGSGSSYGPRTPRLSPVSETSWGELKMSF